ncbi:MAG: MBL fold metallo-hydrolase [Syntrophobacteraceae bacterium]
MEPSKEQNSKGWVPMIVKDTEGEHGPDENEPEQPDWMLLSDIFQHQDPLFRNMLFLEGYDLSSNIFVVVGDYLTVIDPGNDYTAFMQLFAHPEYAPKDIRKIVLTHGHPDHAMGAMELFRYPSIKDNPELEIIIHSDGPSELKRIIHQFRTRVTEVKGGETLDLSGFPWTVIHTPGHTVDGICLHHAPTRTIISGDMALPYGMAAPDKHAGGRMDHYLLSLRSLLGFDIENVLPGHGPPVHSAGRKVIEGSYLAVLLKILGAEPEKAPSLFEIASAAAEAGLPQDAVLCCDMVLAIDANDPRPLKLKAFCLNDIGEFEKAVQAFNLLERRSPSEHDDPFTIMGRGNAALGLGQYQEGLGCFEKVLKIRPGQKEALVYKGFALYLSGKVDEAMEIEEFRSGFEEKFKSELLKSMPSVKAGKQENA